MKSAYSILGIPGNASAADIDQAFQKASAHYSHAKLADDPEAVARLIDIRHAYKLLSSPEMRAAHDRKLSAALSQPAASRPRVVLAAEASPWYTKPLIVMALLVVAMFAIGGSMSYSRDQTRKALAVQELAQKKLEAEAAALADAQQAKIDAERMRAQAKAENQDRQFRAESSMIARQAANADMQQQAMASRQVESDRREKQRRESELRNEERQRVYEAQRKLATDQQRIRELCYQQYRQANC
ncbi:DnaJ domain-containing protein [Polaromonas sp. SM01]|uniref:DnaJ domain-containing protein n=1 Tax=Polaromonas sp. SM01 TaxID=3085630 RepID=UPI0029829EF4|nr:DnaJ domain-containing protein [Polaromonas sp. SM01]MDW5442251.1 DnaJ domain-containing protein [Polaromonas sp. SM01]